MLISHSNYTVSIGLDNLVTPRNGCRLQTFVCGSSRECESDNNNCPNRSSMVKSSRRPVRSIKPHPQTQTKLHLRFWRPFILRTHFFVYDTLELHIVYVRTLILLTQQLNKYISQYKYENIILRL